MGFAACELLLKWQLPLWLLLLLLLPSWGGGFEGWWLGGLGGA